MPMVLTQDGFRWACATLVRDLTGAFLCLFVNDVEPTVNSVLSDFLQPTFTNYAPVPFSPWPATFINPAGNAESDYPTVRFVMGSPAFPVNIYGYMVVDINGFVLWAERDPSAPVLLAHPGDFYPVVPRFQAGLLCALFPPQAIFLGGVVFDGTIS